MLSILSFMGQYKDNLRSRHFYVIQVGLFSKEGGDRRNSANTITPGYVWEELGSQSTFSVLFREHISSVCVCVFVCGFMCVCVCVWGSGIIYLGCGVRGS